MINSPKHTEFVQHPDWGMGRYYRTFDGSGGITEWGKMDPVMGAHNGMSNLWKNGSLPVNSVSNASGDDSFFATSYSPTNSRIYNSKTIYQTYEVNRFLTNTPGYETFFSAPIYTSRTNDEVFTKGSIKFAKFIIQFINIGTENAQVTDANFTVELLVRFRYIKITTPSDKTRLIYRIESINTLFPTELNPLANPFNLFHQGGTFPLLGINIVDSSVGGAVNGMVAVNSNLTIQNFFSATDHCYIKTFAELR